MLTSLAAKVAKPKVRPYKLADGGGLFLLVQPTGSKLWRYKFRLGGIEGQHSLGRFPEVSLADAREKHIRARTLVSRGLNPVHEHRLQAVAVARERDALAHGTFGAVATAWTEATAPKLRPSTTAQRKRELDNDLLPIFKARAIKSIARIELTTLLKTVERRAPEVARNLRAHLFAIFEYAIDSGLTEINPAPPARVLQRRTQRGHPTLVPARLGPFWTELKSSLRVNDETRIAMMLVLLTACRKNEVIAAKWTEFDLTAAEWCIPAARMKAKREHWVPLSAHVIELLARLRSLSLPNSPFLFPNRRDPSLHMAGGSLNALMNRIGFQEGTPHGMRSAFSTYFNSIGASVDVIEHCLAHVPPNKVRAAYNRHTYRDERRSMLQAWSEYLDTLTTRQSTDG